MSFRVHKTFGVPHRDLVVLVGVIEGTPPVAGGSIDLPVEVRGPGWVPILDVQEIELGGRLQTGVVLAWQVLDGAPLMEFADLEGLALDCRRG